MLRPKGILKFAFFLFTVKIGTITQPQSLYNTSLIKLSWDSLGQISSQKVLVRNKNINLESSNAFWRLSILKTSNKMMEIFKVLCDSRTWVDRCSLKSNASFWSSAEVMIVMSESFSSLFWISEDSETVALLVCIVYIKNIYCMS